MTGTRRRATIYLVNRIAVLTASACAAVIGFAAVTAPAATPPGATASAGQAWVGVIELGYTRLFRFPSGASESFLARATIVSRAGGRARASAARQVRNEYPDPGGCRYLYGELGKLSGGVADQPSVTFDRGRYRVGYTMPTVEVTVTEERGCAQQLPRHMQTTALPVYIPLEGRAGARVKRISGSLRRDTATCVTGVECVQTETASWDLHLVGSAGSDGRGGRGRDGRKRSPAGPECVRFLRAGTSASERLVGNARPELFLALDGDDEIRSRGGHDCVWAGPGDDLVIGGPGNDRLHGDSGEDRIRGGRGNDRIDTADGAVDKVDCGPGRDLARADRQDVLRGCEKVRRARRRA